MDVGLELKMRAGETPPWVDLYTSFLSTLDILKNKIELITCWVKKSPESPISKLFFKQHLFVDYGDHLSYNQI